MATTMDKVKQVNEILLNGEPHNISEENRNNGQTYTGYGPQYIIDAMNEVFDLGGWGFDEISNEIVDAPTKNGAQVRALAQVRVWINGVDFKPTAYGQANVTMGDVGDAKKGAQTDSIKKGLSYFSVGNRAYMGLLPPKPKGGQQNKSVQRPNHPQSRPTTPPQTEAPAQEPPPPTIMEIWEQGKKTGMWKDSTCFYEKASGFLKVAVAKGYEFSDGQRRILAQMLEAGKEYSVSKQEQAAEQPAQEKPKLTVVPKQTTKQTSEPAPEQDAMLAISEQQLRSIRKLSEYLNKPEPDKITALTNGEARQIIQQLTGEYKQARAAASAK